MFIIFAIFGLCIFIMGIEFVVTAVSDFIDDEDETRNILIILFNSVVITVLLVMIYVR